MVQIQDCRGFNPKAVSIAQDLGSNNPADYRRIERWINENSKYTDLQFDTLVELFDREVGVSAEERPHPEAVRNTETVRSRPRA